MKPNSLCSLFILPVVLMAIVFPMVAKGSLAQYIPEPARCYFSAIEASDLTALTQCFQPDAVIIDVNRKISGIEAIRTWADNEVIGGRYEIVAIVSQSENNLKLLIKFIPPGL